MNTLDTLYFPGTDIHSVRQYPLFLLFQKVHLITPVEGDPVEGGKESPDSFIKSGFCQVHTPCPLGKDRIRFLRLVEDIKIRKDNYAAQLSSLTLASLSGTASPAEDSERNIIRSLFTPSELQTQADDQARAEQLWQARLVLAIGELLDHEEEEIAIQMAMLEEEEKVLFKDLQGEDEPLDEENPFAELTLMESKLHRTHAGNVKKRFKAWKTLFQAAPIKECRILLTTSPDGGDLLLETHEKMTGTQSSLIAEFQLPAFIGWNSTEANKMVQDFSGENGELLAKFGTTLEKIAAENDLTTAGDKEVDSFKSFISAWNQVLATDFPQERFGRIPLRLYLFPRLSCGELLGKIQSPQVQAANGILAIVG